MGGLAGLAAWTGVSSEWAPSQQEALLAFQRALAYVGIFGLALVAAGSGRGARWLLWTVLGVVVVVVGAGLLSRLYPDLVSSPRLPGERGYRLAYPFGYWNAFGAMASLGTVLAFGLAADPRARPLLRSVATLAAVPLAVAMYLSLSRGAWLALFLGLAVFVALGAHRGSLLLTLAIAGGAAALAILRLRGYPELVTDPRAGDGQESGGQEFGPQLVLLSLAAAAGQYVIARMRSSDDVMEVLAPIGRKAGIVLAGALALVVVLAYVVRADAIEGRTARVLDDTSDWISNQWDDFLTTSNAPRLEGTERLTSARGTRSDIYRVAFDGFESDPMRGEGAGGFEARWLRDRDVDEEVRDAHSLGLETLGELGLPGGLLLLTFLIAVLWAAVRSRLRPGALRRTEAAAAGATFSVWVGHAMVDWDWQMPALTATALLAGAACLPEGRTRVRRRIAGP
jgi:hypothetical protein